MLQTVKKTRIYEAILTQLGQLIQENELKPGDQLPTEREMASQFRVSRASVREALRSLELRGLLVSRQGSGTFIAALNQGELLGAFHRLAEEEQSLRDIFELRLLLEPPIAFLAALRATREEINGLEAALGEQEARIHLEESGAEADVSFHSALAEATHNQALLRLGATLMEVLAPSREMHLQTPQRSQLSLHSHHRILEAVKAGSAEEAWETMEEHIGHVDRVFFGLREEAFPLLGRGPRELSSLVEVAHDQTHRD